MFVIFSSFRYCLVTVGDNLHNDPSNSDLNIPLPNKLADGQSNTVDPTITEHQTGIKNRN